MALPWLTCMALLAQLNHLPPRVLPSIQAVEGGWPGIVSRNTNGTQDLGLMQVNSRWVPAMAAYFRVSPPVARERLIDDPCFNIAAAGAIMRTYMNEAGGDVVRAVGYYHSHNPEHAIPYQYKVINAASGLYGGPNLFRPRATAHRLIPALKTVRERLRLGRAFAMREHRRHAAARRP